MKRTILITAVAALASWAWTAPPTDPGRWIGDVAFLRQAVDSIHLAPYRVHGSAPWDSTAS